MFGLFKKDPKAKLQKQYESLMKESYDLSTVNRAESDKKREEAEAILKQIESL